MKSLLLAVAASLAAVPAFADGPFGIAMGTPMELLSTRDTGAKVMLTSVPNPHPDFDTYFAWGTPETGVCAIIALSKRYGNDRWGHNVRAGFESFAAALDAKYGARETYDAQYSKLWTDPDDWVMAIRQNERVFAAAWSSPGTGDPALSHVELQVAALSSDTALLKLYYKSKDFDRCDAAIKAQANASF